MEDHPETKTKDKPAPRDRPKRRERALEFAPSGAFLSGYFHTSVLTLLSLSSTRKEILLWKCANESEKI